MHTRYSLGIIGAGLILIAGQWFEMPIAIQRLTAGVFLGAIALSMLSAATAFMGLTAFLLIPLAASIPIVIIGSILYGIGFPLSGIGMAGIIAGIAFIGTFVPHARPIFSKQFTSVQYRTPSLPLIGFFISAFCAGAVLAASQTTDAVLGPWQAVSGSFFVFYLIATAFLLLSCMKDGVRSHLVPLTLYGILSTSVAAIVFPLGFGFDPFIHEAAEKHIAQFGILEPKTFYYIGHYVLAVTLSKLFVIDLSLVNRFIMPLGSMLALVPLALAAFKKPILVLLFFMVPYPFLIVSTPWGFAYGITALSILSSMLIWNGARLQWYVLPLLCIMAVFIHPLAGIPTAFFCFAHLFVRHADTANCFVKKLFFFIWTLGGIVALPSAFALNALLSPQLAVTFAWPHISMPSLISLQTRFSLFLDPIYLYQANLYLILICIAIPGFLKFWREGGHRRRFAVVSILSFCLTLINAFTLTHILNFPSLISYERDDYGMRLVSLAFLFLIPFLAHTAALLLARLMADATPHILALASVLFIIAGLAASNYLSYPRNDAFQAFHGYNASAAELTAIQWIRADARKNQFTLLSNQVVSSVLIREYGFGKDAFYYPLPTHSPLYEIYQALLKNPSHELIEQIRRIHPNTRLYIAVNKYEPRFPLIVTALKTIAMRTISFDGDAVIVFAFE